MRLWAERVGAALLVAALLTVLLAPGAGATLWCKRDPYVIVNGRQLNIWVASVDGIWGASREPTRVEIAVPRGAVYYLIGTDEGFGHGYDVEFVEHEELTATAERTQIEVSVHVPAARDLPVKVDLMTPENDLLEWETGVTNDWIVATTEL